MNSRMMKLAMVGLIAMTAAGSMAFVQSGKGAVRSQNSTEQVEGRHCGGGRPGKMLRHLDLTADQKTRIESIRANFQTENAATFERISAIHSQMREARKAGDDARITTLHQEMRAAKESLRPANARMEAQIRAVLTPEQIAQLDKKKGRHGGCRGNREPGAEAAPSRPQSVNPGIE